MSQITTLGGTTVIHLTYKHGSGLGECWRIACMSEVTDFRTSAHQPNYLRSDATPAVTCQQCKETEIFRAVRAKEC